MFHIFCNDQVLDKEQIEKFNHQSDPNFCFTLKFFYFNDEYEQRLNEQFLAQNSQFIKEVIIDLDLLGGLGMDLPTEWLGGCLSKLTNVERLKLVLCCPDVYENTYIEEEEIFSVISRLASVDSLQSIQLDIYPLYVDDGSAEIFQQFLNFLQSCVNLQTFEIMASFIQAKLFNQLLDVLVSRPLIKNLKVCHREHNDPSIDIGAVDLPDFGKLFSIPSLMSLYLSMSGVHFIDPKHKNETLEKKVKDLVNQFPICSQLSDLTLNFEDLGCDFSQDEDDDEYEELNLDYSRLRLSLKAFDAIARNKSLRSLELLLPDNCYESSQYDLWNSFIQKFKLSSLESFELNFLQYYQKNSNYEILKFDERDKELILNENKKINQQVSFYRQFLTTPYLPLVMNRAQKEYFPLNMIKRLDIRLKRSDLKLAHYRNQRQLMLWDDDVLYSYFCTVLVLKLHASSHFFKNFSSGLLMMSILSYLDSRDFSQMVCLSPGILQTIRRELVSLVIEPFVYVSLFQNSLYQMGSARENLSSIIPELFDESYQNQFYERLSRENFRFACLIQQDDLNSISQGISIALRLAKTEQGCVILAAHEYRLARLITERTLNHVVDGFSVAMGLSMHPTGREILALDNNRLAKSIDPEVRNMISSQSSLNAQSLFFQDTQEERDILATNTDSEEELVGRKRNCPFEEFPAPKKR